MRHAWLQIYEGGLEAGAAESYQGGAEVVDEVVDEHIAVPGTQRMSIKISLDGRRLGEYSETLLETTLDV